jgi:hypothetical protein
MGSVKTSTALLGPETSLEGLKNFPFPWVLSGFRGTPYWETASVKSFDV